MKCTNNACGQELDVRWEVCPFCRTPVPKKPTCRKCGEELNPKWTVCPFCNTEVFQNAPSTSLVERFDCVDGSVIRDTDSFFKCQECGGYCLEENRVKHPKGLKLPMCRNCGDALVRPLWEKHNTEKAREEAERKRREEAERKRREEAERKKREEAERKRKAREEAERKRREEEERKRREEEERKQRDTRRCDCCQETMPYGEPCFICMKCDRTVCSECMVDKENWVCVDCFVLPDLPDLSNLLLSSSFICNCCLEEKEGSRFICSQCEEYVCDDCMVDQEDWVCKDCMPDYLLGLLEG